MDTFMGWGGAVYTPPPEFMPNFPVFIVIKKTPGGCHTPHPDGWYHTPHQWYTTCVKIGKMHKVGGLGKLGRSGQDR